MYKTDIKNPACKFLDGPYKIAKLSRGLILINDEVNRYLKVIF